MRKVSIDIDFLTIFLCFPFVCSTIVTFYCKILTPDARMFLVNDSSTKFGAIVETLCFSGFTRDGPFQRRCELTG